MAETEFELKSLIKKYHNRLIRLVKNIVGDEYCEEVCQEAWIKIMRALPDFEGRSHISTWLTRIVINTAKSHLRKPNPTTQSIDTIENILSSRFDQSNHWSAPPVQWNNDSPEQLLSSQELQQCLTNSFDNLPTQQKLVLDLHDLQGESIEEICNSLEISASNCRVLLHRARCQLWSAVEKYQEGRHVKL